MTIDQVEAAIRNWQIPSTTDEFALHATLEKILKLEGIAFEREKIISQTERLDFLCGGNIAIEVKTAGAVPALVSQLQRYADSDLVHGIVVVTTRRQHLLGVSEIGGKPLRVVWIFSQM